MGGLEVLKVAPRQLFRTTRKQRSRVECTPHQAYIPRRSRSLFPRLIIISNRQIYNSSNGLVRRWLNGGVAQNPALHPSFPSTRTAVLPGGGAGYEPAHADYTCNRMLTSSLSGGVFASPNCCANSPTHRDVVVIVKNYIDDRLHFGPCIQMFPPSLGPTILTTFLSCLHWRCIGGALGHCHVPGRKPHSAFQLIADDNVGLELGLYDEPGVCCASLESSCWLATVMLLRLDGANIYQGEGVSTFDTYEPWLREDGVTVLFMNSLGGISQLEIGAVVEEVLSVLASQKIVPSRVYRVPFMTSLSAPGFSISDVNVSRTYELINSDSSSFRMFCVRSWSWQAQVITGDEAQVEVLLRTFTSSPSGSSQSSSDRGSTQQGLSMLEEKVNKAIRYACQAVLVPEPGMPRFVTVVGDGDCRETFTCSAKGLFRTILVALDSGTLDPAKTVPAAFVSKVGEILEGSIGGSTSALPFCAVLSSEASLEDAVIAVKEGAANLKTRGMKARLERASYVGGGEGRISVPLDPGALGVANIVVGFANGMAV
ncbi:DAK1 DegV-like protein [Suillus subluteus]|nr:DAK1 DegV-like protein [Suillus subluteus]